MPIDCRSFKYAVILTATWASWISGEVANAAQCASAAARSPRVSFQEQRLPREYYAYSAVESLARAVPLQDGMPVSVTQRTALLAGQPYFTKERAESPLGVEQLSITVKRENVTSDSPVLRGSRIESQRPKTSLEEWRLAIEQLKSQPQTARQYPHEVDYYLVFTENIRTGDFAALRAVADSYARVTGADGVRDAIREFRARHPNTGPQPDTTVSNARVYSQFELSPSGQKRYFYIRNPGGYVKGEYHGKVLDIAETVRTGVGDFGYLRILVELTSLDGKQRVVTSLMESDFSRIRQTESDVAAAGAVDRARVSQAGLTNLGLLQAFVATRPSEAHSGYETSRTEADLYTTGLLPGRTNGEFVLRSSGQTVREITENWDASRAYYWAVDSHGNFLLSAAQKLSDPVLESRLNLVSNNRPLYVGGYLYVGKSGKLIVGIENSLYQFVSPQAWRNDSIRRGISRAITRILHANLGPYQIESIRPHSMTDLRHDLP